MTLNVRRVVTGHDSKGRPVVLIDKQMGNVVSRRTGQLETQIWSTDADFAKGVDDAQERKLREADTHIASGTVFRIVNYAPGVKSHPHRNDWIDYTIILSGEIDMQLEATEVHLKAGDVVVQRGTIHDWINRGTEHCTIAFVRVGAKPEE